MLCGKDKNTGLRHACMPDFNLMLCLQSVEAVLMKCSH